MKEFEYLSHPEQLSALLDGEFEVGDASNLFFELAQNPELQEQFRDHILMKKFIGKSVIAPPDHLKHNILVGTGLISSTALTLGGLAYSSIGRFLFSALKSRGFMMGFSALLGSLATLFYLNITTPDINPTASNSIQSGLQNNPVAQKTENINNIESNFVNKTNKKERITQLPVIKSTESENVSNQINGGNISLNKDNNTNENYNNSIAELPKNITLSNLNMTSDVQLNNRQYQDELPLKNNRNNLINELPLLQNFSLQVRHFFLASIPQIDVEPLDRPALNNMGLSLAYHYTDDIAFGIEGGQENFLQKYHGRDSTIEQNYLAFWLGAYYHQSLDKIEELGGIQPFIRGFIGGTKIGPYLRGMLGIQYALYKQLYVFTALESGVLFYRYQGNNFSTQKFGLTYGVSVRF